MSNPTPQSSYEGRSSQKSKDQDRSEICLGIVAEVDPLTPTRIIVSAAVVDRIGKRLWLSTFRDSPDTLGNLECLALQMTVTELFLSSLNLPVSIESSARERIEGIASMCGITVTTLMDPSVPSAQKSAVRGAIKASGLLDELSELSAAAQGPVDAAALLLSSLEVGVTAEELEEEWGVEVHRLGEYMRVDTSAIAALNLLPEAHNAGSSHLHLYGVLNRCRTAQGSRLLAQWIKKPLTQVAAIEARLSLVAHFIDHEEIRQALQDTQLKRKIPDLTKLSRKFRAGRADLQDVIRVYQVIRALPGVIALLEQLDHPLIEERFLRALRTSWGNMEKLAGMVEETVDLEKADYHVYVIRSEYDDTLRDLERQKEELTAEMEAEFRGVGKMLRVDTEKKLKLEHSQVFGHCMRLTRNDSGCLRSSGIRGIIELATQKAGVYFTTTKLRRCSEDFKSMEAQYAKRQSGLVKEVVDVVATYCGELDRVGETVADLDVLMSFSEASLVAPIPYVRPTVRGFTEARALVLEGARHPVLEAAMQDGGGGTVITNDLEFREGEREVLLVTGPNMGGKSTYIRQAGVIVLMAQIGCFVPCVSADISVVDAILARVGAGDNQQDGLSTFMSEMLESAHILKAATPHSLVIIDELGRGTSTQDGFGLAWAISEQLARKTHCFTLFATHFHELTELSKSYKGVGNVHVTVESRMEEGGERSMTLLYKVEEGVCDESFGIHVAELAKFPVKVIQLGKRKADLLERGVEEERGGRERMEKVFQAMAGVAQGGEDLLERLTQAVEGALGAEGDREWEEEMLAAFV